LGFPGKSRETRVARRFFDGFREPGDDRTIGGLGVPGSRPDQLQARDIDLPDFFQIQMKAAGAQAFQ